MSFLGPLVPLFWISGDGDGPQHQHRPVGKIRTCQK